MATIALVQPETRRTDAGPAVRSDNGLGFFKGLSIGLALSAVFWIAVGNIVWSALT